MAGLGSGTAWVAIVAYNTEVSPRQMRGLLCSLVDVAINSGIVLGFLADLALFGDSWRLVFSLGMIPPLAMFVFLPAMPESPRWLFVFEKQRDAARAVLVQIEDSQPAVDKRLDELDRLAAEETPSWSEILTTHAGRAGLVVAVLLGFLQQAVGTEAILYYSTTMIEAAGVTGVVEVNRLQLAVAACKCMGEFVALAIADRVGRRPLLLTSSALVSLVMLLLGVAYLASLPAWVPVALLCLVMFCFNVGMAPLTMVLVGELSPSRYRARLLAIAVTVNRLTAGLAAFTFEPLKAGLGSEGAVFLIYSALAAMTCATYHSLVPEMANITLDSTEFDPPPLWRWLVANDDGQPHNNNKQPGKSADWPNGRAASSAAGRDPSIEF